LRLMVFSGIALSDEWAAGLERGQAGTGYRRQA
jgi:hypothetical protein